MELEITHKWPFSIQRSKSLLTGMKLYRLGEGVLSMLVFIALFLDGMGHRYCVCIYHFHHFSYTSNSEKRRTFCSIVLTPQEETHGKDAFIILLI